MTKRTRDPKQFFIAYNETKPKLNQSSNEEHKAKRSIKDTLKLIGEIALIMVIYTLTILATTWEVLKQLTK